MVNVNKMFGTPEERLYAANAGLRRTALGQGNVIRAELDNDSVVYVLNVTGVKYDSLARAIQESAKLHITEMSNITQPRLGNKMSDMAQLKASMHKNLSRLNAGQLNILQQAGIDIQQLQTFDMDVLTMHGGRDLAGTAQRAQELLSNGQVHGIPFVDKDGVRLLRIRQGNQALDSYQTHLLLSMTNHDVLDPEVFRNILNSKTPEYLSKQLAKVHKRSRAFLSEREVSLAGGDLLKFLGAGAQSMADKTLVLDPQYDLLKKMAHEVSGRKPWEFGKNAGLKAFYADKNVDNFVGSILDEMSPTFKDGLLKHIADFKADPSSRFQSDALEKYLDNIYKNDKNGQALVKRMFESIEYAFDGSDLLNKAHFRGYVGGLTKEINGIKKSLLATNISAGQKADLQLRLKELSNIKRQVQGSALQQITGRGNMPGYGNIKTAFDIKFFGQGLEDYAMIISKFGFKRELGLIGQEEVLNLSLFGKIKDEVYVDPVSAAFHPEIFADKETLDAITARGETVFREYEAAIEQGLTPQRVKSLLESAANRDIDSLPVNMRASALRSKMWAESAQELIKSGARPQDIPMLQNILHNSYATRAFREKDGMIQAVLPDTYRFAVDSEAILVNEKSILGRGYTKIGGMQDAAGQAIQIDKDILQFRVQGHKLMMSGEAIGRYRHALGGFDLDDKALPKLVTYKDNNGMTRLGYHIFRQPSGPEETIFARAAMDVQTMRALFGDDDYFLESLDQMYQSSKGTADESVFNSISEILHGRMSNVKRIYGEDILSGADRYESAIIKVYEHMEKTGKTKLARLTDKQIAAIAKYGSSSLETLDVTANPQYTRNGIFKLLTEEGAFDMSEDIRSLIDKSAIDSALKTKLKQGTFEDMMRNLGASYDQPAARALFQQAFADRALKAASAEGGILGVFVNRSMAVGSTLNQYQAFLENLDPNAQKFFIQNFKVGLLPQEEAIDLSILFSDARRLSQNLTNIVANNAAALNEPGIAKTIMKLTGGNPNAPMSIDAIGDQMMMDLGRMIGGARAAGQGVVAENLMLGLDELLLTAKGDLLEKQRLGQLDIENIIKGMISGIEEVQGQSFYTASTETDQFLADLKEVQASQSQSKMRDFLMKKISLNAEHEFANLSKLNNTAARVENYFEVLRRASISRIKTDPILAAAQVGDEARSAAQKILDKHKDDIDELMNVSKDQLKYMDDLALNDLELRRLSLGERFYKDIAEASQMRGMTMEGLVNAFDKITEGTRLNIGNFNYIFSDQTGNLTDSSFAVHQGIHNVRKARRVAYYAKADQTLANEIISNLNNGNLTLDNIERLAERMIDSSANESDMVNNVYKVLAGQDQDISDDIIRQEAQKQNEIIRAQLLRAELEDSGALDELTAQGNISTVNEAISQFGDDTAITDDMLRSLDIGEDATVNNKAVYKRISEKFNDGSLSNLFKDPIIRRGTLAIGALVVSSFAYAAYKDRTAEDAAGPPLLPGGSAYESSFPIRIPEIGTFNGQGYESGVTYKVNLYGDQDLARRFKAAASGLVNGNMNTTIYNRIPSVTDDPYSRMASSY